MEKKDSLIANLKEEIVDLEWKLRENLLIKL